MPELVGGIGLGAVLGWIAAATPLPRGPSSVAATLLALGAILAVSSAVAGGGAALALLAGAFVGFASHTGLRFSLR